MNSQDAVVCTIDGEVWKITGITNQSGEVIWQRIATGLFQPLGIRVFRDEIYVGCRDQIVRLHDLNGDEEIDFYESFNSDHQVTEHFHEFAMGLQVDQDGNFYYAKSGRHARTSLVPQHGTLIKVSSDGQTSTILANGFRAANGVCLNPDGSFFVTDQEGYWNPMNRINRVKPGGFYGNMWGYGAPADTSDQAMEMPLCWIDMKYDRSPAELLWVAVRSLGAPQWQSAQPFLWLWKDLCGFDPAGWRGISRWYCRTPGTSISNWPFKGPFQSLRRTALHLRNVCLGNQSNVANRRFIPRPVQFRKEDLDTGQNPISPEFHRTSVFRQVRATFCHST